MRTRRKLFKTALVLLLTMGMLSGSLEVFGQTYDNSVDKSSTQVIGRFEFYYTCSEDLPDRLDAYVSEKIKVDYSNPVNDYITSLETFASDKLGRLAAGFEDPESGIQVPYTTEDIVRSKREESYDNRLYTWTDRPGDSTIIGEGGDISGQGGRDMTVTGDYARTTLITLTKTYYLNDHKWDEGVVTKAATETETGIRTFTCQLCKETKTETIPAEKPTPPVPPSTPVKTQPMFRMYNPNSGEHFYTASGGEKNALIRMGWNYEGIGWTAPEKSKTPVYRLYNPNAGDHHYTTNAGEKNALVNVGWKYEGIGWYSDDVKGTALYRQYNPNAKTGTHNYTTSKKENDWLVTLGWQAEGIGWYGVKK